MKRARNGAKMGPLPRGVADGADPLLIRRRGRRRELFNFKTLVQAEHTLERLSNLMAEREESEMERLIAEDRRTDVAQKRLECQARGTPPEDWPEFPKMPPLRGLSVATGGKIVSAINAFIIARRFSDEFTAKEENEALKQQVLELIERAEGYRRQVAELTARQQLQ